MHREARSVEQWREYLNDSMEGKRGRFRTMSREMMNSVAFAKLSKGGITAVFAMLDKLEYEKKGQRDRKGVQVFVPILKTGGVFSIAINEIIARGVGKSSAIQGRVQAWELGFFDVIQPGTLHHAGRYKYSERWKLYPNGAYHPTGQQPPGLNVYPENGFKSSKVSEPDESTSSKVIFPEFAQRR